MSQEILNSLLKTSLRVSGQESHESTTSAEEAKETVQQMSPERQAFLREALESIGKDEAQTLQKAHTTLETLAKLLYEHKETLGTGALTNEEQLADEASAIPALTQQEGVPSVSESIEACEEVCTFVETIDSSIGWLHSGGMDLLKLFLGIHGVNTSVTPPQPSGTKKVTNTSSALDSRVLNSVSRIVQCVAQNNEQAQKELTESGVLKQAIELLKEIIGSESHELSTSDADLMRSLISGIGSIIRSAIPPQNLFLQNGGVALLLRCLQLCLKQDPVDCACLRKVTLVVLGLVKTDDSQTRTKTLADIAENCNDEFSGHLAAALNINDVQVRENIANMLRSLQQTPKAVELFPSICGKMSPNPSLYNAVKNAMEKALRDNVAVEELKAVLAILRSKSTS